jgi:molybdopterin-guanine dinucleotide biosynthesis protein A
MKALILAGGESRRFGQDKALLMSEKVYHLLLPFFAEVWVSCRATQNFSWTKNILLDSSTESEGPGAGFRAASLKDSESPWFIVACDMVGVDSDCVKFLKTFWEQKPNLPALLFGTVDTKEKTLYEPLLGVWSAPALACFRREPAPGPQAIAREVQATALTCPEPRWLINRNTPT